MNGMYLALVVCSTTLGETAGDFISQMLHFGYGGAAAGHFIIKDGGMHLGNAKSTLLLFMVLSAVAMLAHAQQKKHSATFTE